MDPANGLGIPRESNFEGQRDLIIELSQDLGKQTLEGHKQKFMCTRTQGKGEMTPQETESDLP